MLYTYIDTYEIGKQTGLVSFGHTPNLFVWVNVYDGSYVPIDL